MLRRQSSTEQGNLLQIGATGFEPATFWSQRTSENRCFLRKNHDYRHFTTSARAFNTFRPIALPCLFFRYFRRYRQAKTVQRRYMWTLIPIDCFWRFCDRLTPAPKQARHKSPQASCSRLPEASAVPNTRYTPPPSLPGRSQAAPNRPTMPQDATVDIGRQTGHTIRPAAPTGHSGSPRHPPARSAASHSTADRTGELN